MGIFDFLTQGSAAPTQVTGSQSTTALPPWYEDYYRNLLAAGVSTASEDYLMNPNQRIAALRPFQEEGIEAAQGRFGDWDSPLSQLALTATERGGAPFDPSQLSEFMNPYSEQVADIIGQRGEARYLDKFIDPVMDTFTAGGQFGSQRNMDFARKAMQDASREITDAQTLALERGFGEGMQGYQGFQNLALQGGAQAANLWDKSLAGAMDLTGMQQGLDQQSLDLLTKDFEAQRDYPWLQMDRLKNLAGGISPGTTSSTQTAGPATGNQGPSPLEILAGIYGAIQQGG